jgi:hypothetical protein
MWPASASSICASVGLGFVRNNATALITWPLWQ